MKAIIFFFILDIIVSKFSFFSVVKISVGASNAIIPTYTAYHYPGMFFSTQQMLTFTFFYFFEAFSLPIIKQSAMTRTSFVNLFWKYDI